MTTRNYTTLIRRIAAMLYDSLLVFACLVMLAIISTAYLGGHSVYAGGPGYVLAYNFARFSIIFLFFVYVLVTQWSHPGHAVLATAARDHGGWQRQHRVCNHSVFRGHFFHWAPAGLGFIWSLWDKDKLTWHDRISKTRIVYYPKKRT